MWKIGDRVIVVEAPSRTLLAEVGYKGTVIDIKRKDILIEFDNFINGHSGTISSYNGRFGHCYWLRQLDDPNLIGWFVNFDSRERDFVCKKLKKKITSTKRKARKS